MPNGIVTGNPDFPASFNQVGVNNLNPQFQLDVGGDINTSGLYHSFVYSAAGTPLPSASAAGAGARAFVSDATANVYGTNYASGGSITAPVYSDGTNWNMG